MLLLLLHKHRQYLIFTISEAARQNQYLGIIGKNLKRSYCPAKPKKLCEYPIL